MREYTVRVDGRESRSRGDLREGQVSLRHLRARTPTHLPFELFGWQSEACPPRGHTAGALASTCLSSSSRQQWPEQGTAVMAVQVHAV